MIDNNREEEIEKANSLVILPNNEKRDEEIQNSIKFAETRPHQSVKDVKM